MTTYVILEIPDDEEAADFFRDTANYPKSALLTPCLEHEVHFRIVFSGDDLRIVDTDE